MESAENREQPLNSETVEDKQLSKDKAIAILKDTIQQLEGIVEDIDTSQQEDLVLNEPIDNLLKTTQELAETVTPVVPETDNSDSYLKDGVAEAASQESVSTKTQGKKQKRSPLLLVGGIAGVVIVAAIAIWQFFPLQSSQLIASKESTVTETKVITDKVDVEDIGKAIQEDTTFVSPQVEPEIINETTETIIETENIPPETVAETPSEPEEIVSIAIPTDLVSPGRAKNLKIKTIEPKITLTPEQKLIAVVQSKANEITASDPENIIASIEPDFINSSLEVRVNDIWDELNTEQQNKTANDILSRSRKLNFQKLEIRDTEGILVARNPVVGDRAIVIQPLEQKSDTSEN